MVQLRPLPIRPAVAPHLFFPKAASKVDAGGSAAEGGEAAANDNDEEAEEEGLPEEGTDFEEVLSSLAVRKMPTEHSRWQLSVWNRLCPVQLYNGILEYGKVAIAVGCVNRSDLSFE